MEPDLRMADLVADWERQRYRVIVPCVGTQNYQWHRTGQVAALGELFMALGKKWTASAIYAFYRTLRVVVLKRRKHKSFTRPGQFGRHDREPLASSSDPAGSSHQQGCARGRRALAVHSP